MSPDAERPNRADPADRPPPPREVRGSARFATTRWSLVLAAGASGPGAGRDGATAREALAVLCRTYWYPLYAFVRRRGHAPEEAQDLTQSFFVRLLEKNILRAADPERGRFRSFLLASLKYFLANEWDKAAAQKRGGGAVVLPLDVPFDAAEHRYAREPADTRDTLTPERLYEREWALALLDAVLDDLRDKYHAEGKGALFDRLKPYLTGDAAAPAYAEVAAAAGMTGVAVQVAVHRLRKRYRKLLRDHIERTVDPPATVEEEIRDLFRAVRG